MAAVTLVMGDTARVPYDRGTFGSRTTPQMGVTLGRAAAAARAALLDLAAERLQVTADALRVETGRVLERDGGRALSFGKLTQGQAITRTVADESELASPAAWQVAGHSAARVDGAAFVTGRHRYTSDLAVPDMLHGKVLRSPFFRGRRTSLDTSAAQAMAGVQVVLDGDFVGVVAAGIEIPYAVPHRHVEFHPAESPLRQGSYRALAATANHFARECHLDEIARVTGQDPLELRLRLLENDRLQDVLRAAAERFGWPGRQDDDQVASGLACGTEKGGFVATCAGRRPPRQDRRPAPGHRVRVRRAGEPGPPREPGGRRRGHGSRRRVVRGRGVRGRPHPEPRLRPLSGPPLPGPPGARDRPARPPGLPAAGAGETPIIAVAPAIANAVLAATGKPLRRLPLSLG